MCAYSFKLLVIFSELHNKLQKGVGEGGGPDDRGHLFFLRISGIISYLLEPGGLVPATGESGYLSTLQPKVTNTKRKEKGKHVGKS